MSNPVIQLGIPRSGSTFIWQVLGHLLGRENVLKAHPADPELLAVADILPKVVTIRHPMDVVASLWAIREPDEQTPKDLLNVIAYADDQFKSLDRWLCGEYVTLKYEEFWSDPESIFPLIERMLKIQFPNTEYALRGCSLEENRKRASRMKTFAEHDPATHIHGKHIGAVKPGSWKHVLPEWSHNIVAQVMQHHIREWEYPE